MAATRGAFCAKFRGRFLLLPCTAMASWGTGLAWWARFEGALRVLSFLSAAAPRVLFFRLARGTACYLANLVRIQRLKRTILTRPLWKSRKTRGDRIASESVDRIYGCTTPAL